MAQYTRTTTIDAAPGGDSVKQAVLDLDTDLTGIVDAYDIHDALTTTAHSMTQGMQLGESGANKLAYALSADGKYSAIEATIGALGQTVAFGEVCYFKASDSKWWKAQADVAATASPELGFCVTAGNPSATTTLLTRGNIRADSLFDTFTVGAPIFLSAATAGKATATAPSGTNGFVVRVLGRAQTADSIKVDISPDYMELA